MHALNDHSNSMISDLSPLEPVLPSVCNPGLLHFISGVRAPFRYIMSIIGEVVLSSEVKDALPQQESGHLGPCSVSFVLECQPF